MTLVLNEAQIETISKHGESAYPNECCGFLIGRIDDGAKVTVKLLAAENAREDAAQVNRFLITPDDYRAADKLARQDGLDVVGFYHSHPDHPNRPSDYDRDHAWPFYSYVIVAVANGQAEQTASWVLRDERDGFDEEDIRVLPVESTIATS
jgi:proteasome lid subunit RPN8/RPN11